jgi:hypothetical protein
VFSNSTLLQAARAAPNKNATADTRIEPSMVTKIVRCGCARALRAINACAARHKGAAGVAHDAGA